MKKITVFALILALLVCLSACGKAGLANPMHELDSLEALSKAANCALIRPEGVELSDESFAMIDGEVQIAQYAFTVDGQECTLRFADVGVETDISGIYDSDGTTVLADSTSASHYLENNSLKIQRWVTLDGQYVFSVVDDSAWTYDQFDKICSQFMALEPKNWTSDVPYADYRAMEGYFTDGTDAHMAGTSIEGDKLAVYIYIAKDEGTLLAFELHGELQGDKLVYDKETSYTTTYDQSTGEPVITHLEDGGAGYIDISNRDVLDFSGACSEYLQPLKLTRSAQY